MRLNIILTLALVCLILSYRDRSVPLPVFYGEQDLSAKARRDILSVLKKTNF